MHDVGGKFLYNPEGVRFLSYYRRYKKIFKKDNRVWLDEKVCLLLRKFCPLEHEKYFNYILPDKSGNVTSDENFNSA